ncbi:hypothetical protein [Echinicola salinicaeni]|uniref:hypothetical protein n=1 Tax=Echinicola salinicaeni TaxID=2762757 RepID=UPI001644319C|nr:hypothetical protein [Echinicola salinicaeni]
MTATASNYNTSVLNQNTFSFKSVIRNNVQDRSNINVYDWLQQHDAVKVEGKGAFDFANFKNSNKSFQVVYFSLDAELADHYALFRGIVLAGQPKEVFLENVHEKRSFSLKFYKNNESVAKEYLEKVFRIVNEEIRFKKVLRKVLVNQEKHRLEEKLLLNELSL